MTYKVLIQGAWGSGKTSFIRTITEIDIVSTSKDDEKVNQNYVKENTTVAMDFGRITSEDASVFVYLFGVPGARRDFWMELIETSLGIILMVDSRHPETFRQTLSLFHTFRYYSPLPIVIAANFQDLPDAWDVDALRIALQIPNDILILPCVATDRESVKRVMVALLNEVLKDIEADMDEDACD